MVDSGHHPCFASRRGKPFGADKADLLLPTGELCQSVLELINLSLDSYPLCKVVKLLLYFCSLCQNAPEQFTSEEFPVTESKVSMDVSFPGAAFVIVSCKESQLGCRKE